jgi:hypothetical protein
VLCVLGFAATDLITITLSAADATAHVIGNPFVLPSFNHSIALMLYIRDQTRQVPHAYFGWTE